MPRVSRRAALYHRLGVRREREGDWIGAAAAFESAADADPAWAARHWRLGEARTTGWDLAGAARAYAAAVALAPHRVAWCQRLASAQHAAAHFRPFNGLVIAHRGAAGGGPENARESLEHLPDTTAGVEVDVRLSSDKVPVLMHDARVDRTTDGHGLVAALSCAELRELRGQQGARIPTLAEYLDACADMGFRSILLDVKTPTHNMFEALSAVVRASPVRRSCVVLVRGEEQLREFRRTSRDLRLGGLGTTLGTVVGLVEAAHACRAEMLLLAHGDVPFLDNRGAIGSIRRAGLLAGGSIVNSREALEAAREERCDILLTDRADQLAYFTGKVSAGAGRSADGATGHATQSRPPS